MDHLLFEKHPSPMLIYDLDTLVIIKVNNSFLQKYKYTAAEIASNDITIRDIRPPEDIPKLEKALKINSKSNSGITETSVFRHQAKDGEIFFVKITSQPYPLENRRAG